MSRHGFNNLKDGEGATAYNTEGLRNQYQTEQSPANTRLRPAIQETSTATHTDLDELINATNASRMQNPNRGSILE